MAKIQRGFGFDGSRSGRSRVKTITAAHVVGPMSRLSGRASWAWNIGRPIARAKRTEATNARRAVSRWVASTPTASRAIRPLRKVSACRPGSPGPNRRSGMATAQIWSGGLFVQAPAYSAAPRNSARAVTV